MHKPVKMHLGFSRVSNLNIHHYTSLHLLKCFGIFNLLN